MRPVLFDQDNPTPNLTTDVLDEWMDAYDEWERNGRLGSRPPTSTPGEPIEDYRSRIAAWRRALASS